MYLFPYKWEEMVIHIEKEHALYNYWIWLSSSSTVLGGFIMK